MLQDIFGSGVRCSSLLRRCSSILLRTGGGSKSHTSSLSRRSSPILSGAEEDSSGGDIGWPSRYASGVTGDLFSCLSTKKMQLYQDIIVEKEFAKTLM